MSRRRKRTYLLLMFVGAIALAADRMLIPADLQTPSVAAATMVKIPTTISPLTSAEQSAKLIPSIPFPKGVATYVPSEPIANLFIPPDERSNITSGSVESTKSDRRRPDNVGQDAFIRTHTLRAVLLQEGLKIAVINDLWLQIGDSVNGCTLRAVSGATVEFACTDGVAVLQLSLLGKRRDD